MKHYFTVITLVTVLMISLIAGCKNPLEEKIIGIWMIEDIQVSGDTNLYDADKFNAAIEDQKNLRFELREDSVLHIYTGASEINGFWTVERSSEKVFVTLQGNIEPTLLGVYRGGKLYNSDTTMMGVIINTTFMKEEAVEK